MTAVKPIISLLLLLPALSYALPPEFTATYTAETYGMTVTESTYTLKHKNKGVIFSQHTAPTGFARFFSDDELDETSHLSFHNNSLLLDEYHYIQKGTKDNKDIHLNITWDDKFEKNISGMVSGSAGNDDVIINIDAPVWDTLSFQIPLMAGTNTSITTQELAVLVKGKLKIYHFVVQGEENITIGDKSFTTLKIERQSDDRNKPLFFWIAPELNNLPVKIEKWKKGKPHITMLLNYASFPSDKSIQFEIEEDFDDL